MTAPESGQERDVEVVPQQMGETVVGTWRNISAEDIPHPAENPWRYGPGNTAIMARVGDRWLCRHDMVPAVLHGDNQHRPEPFPGGQRTPGVHPDTADGRAQNQDNAWRPRYR